MSGLCLSGDRGHDLPDLALHGLLAHTADAPFAEDARPVYEEVRWDADGAVLGGDTCRLVDAGGEGRAGTLDVARYGAGGLTDAYRQHYEAITFIGLVDLLDVGSFGAAGWAPGSPEVDPDGPPAEVAQLDDLTVEGAQAEVGGLASEAGGGRNGVRKSISSSSSPSETSRGPSGGTTGSIDANPPPPGVRSSSTLAIAVQPPEEQVAVVSEQGRAQSPDEGG